MNLFTYTENNNLNSGCFKFYTVCRYTNLENFLKIVNRVEGNYNIRSIFFIKLYYEYIIQNEIT